MCVLAEPPQLVSELMDTVNRQWNREKIASAFISMDTEAILSIPLSFRRQDDFWAWHYDRRGVFSVRSAYRMLVQTRETRTAWLDETAASSDHAREEKSWVSMWKLQVPPKIRAFLVEIGPTFATYRRCTPSQKHGGN